MAFTKITNTNIAANTVASYAEFANFASALAPKITSIAITSNTYSVLDDAAVNVGGGFIVVTGSNFESGATVLIDTTPASAVTYVNSNTLRAQVPARSAASYNLYVVNPDGGTGIRVSGITYSGSPTWVTASPLANVSSNTVFSGTFNATGATSYANTTILPTGFNLLANGYYFGNISIGASQTTYSFDIRATDAELQDSDKTFSLTTINVPPTYTVEYLVVAGGGSGGASTGGGGGAGGLLYGSTVVNSGNVLSIVVGAGGSGVAVAGTASNNGNLSSFENINAVGGGGGGSFTASPVGTVHNGRPGGSGGGTSIRPPLSGGTVGAGTAGQGFPGGDWRFNSYPSGSASGMGGGGGAAEAGKQGINAPIFGVFLTAGAGGNGYTWPFTGTTYAGGGGGAVTAPNPDAPYTTNGGAGGSGGGGAGGRFHSFDPGSSINGSSGTTNSGGGGGGGTSGTSGSGGSGVVILAVPTPNYPGSAPGATVTTPPAAPGKTVLTFNSSGTYTA